MSSTQERPVPPRAAAARRTAAEADFRKSCSPEVGRLLALTAAARPGGVVAESGTGSGVGTAWLHSGLATDARLVTVERGPELARRAAGLLTDDPASRTSPATGACSNSTPPSTPSSATAAADATPRTR